MHTEQVNLRGNRNRPDRPFPFINLVTLDTSAQMGRCDQRQSFDCGLCPATRKEQPQQTSSLIRRPMRVESCEPHYTGANDAVDDLFILVNADADGKDCFAAAAQFESRINLRRAKISIYSPGRQSYLQYAAGRRERRSQQVGIP